MDFESFLREFSRKFQEGDSSKHYISGFFYGFFHISWTIVKKCCNKDVSKENVQWFLNSF
jgi:hypothetical protein